MESRVAEMEVVEKKVAVVRPMEERASKEPIGTVMGVDELFPVRGKPDTEALRAHLAGEGRLTEEAAMDLVGKATAVFRQEPTLLRITSPVSIVGDIHGQYFDLLKLTTEAVGGDPKATQYLFLGDYVDRGQFSLECILYLYALKIRYPSSVWLLRGNHECRHLTTYFSFKKECLVKMSENFYDACLESFNCLPLAGLVNGRFLCVHGGLSPSVNSLADIEGIQRHSEPPQYGPMCDLLWADPVPGFGGPSSPDGEHFLHNKARGCSFSFTYEAVVGFLERNGLTGIIRAHEAQADGFTMHRKTPASLGGFPALITVFSAPNYLDVYGNKAAVIKFDTSNMNIRQFNASPHPYWLPNFMDVFSWSLPFMADKVTDMMERVLEICTDEELLKDADDGFEGGMSSERKRAIRSKITAIGRIHRTFATLREEEEAVLSLKGLSPSGRLPPGLLAEGTEGLRDKAELVERKGLAHPRLRQIKDLHDVSFDEAKVLDSPNERCPPFADKAKALKRPPIRPPTTPLPANAPTKHKAH